MTQTARAKWKINPLSRIAAALVVISIHSTPLVASNAAVSKSTPSSGANSAPDEAVGPFPSWRDLRRDYGAVGDGKADDTAAFQRALDDLMKHEKSCVLFVPAGTYRLTSSLKTLRKAHRDYQGVSIVGDAPETTTLKWDGGSGATMLQWDAWYAKLSRLRFDGAGRAGIAVEYGPSFSTYNETSDLVFNDVETGLRFGGPTTQGQAENEVLRCRFNRCRTGVETANWNSMDIWVWYCQFTDCERGVHNRMGNWHVWESLFLRSRKSDLSTENLMVFSVVNNTSIGSRCFFDFSGPHTWGSPVSLTGNRIIDCTGDFAVVLDNAGPYLIADNSFRLSDGRRAIRCTWGDQVLIQNSYSHSNAVEEHGRCRRIAEKEVSARLISTTTPTLPATPPRSPRDIIEIPPGADGHVIQAAIDAAGAKPKARSIVHFPAGKYSVNETLVVSPGGDFELVGDGAGESATRLEWYGPDNGLLLELRGPTRVTLRDLYMYAPNGRVISVTNSDQKGGRIFADQLNVRANGNRPRPKAAALSIETLTRTDVLLRALQGEGGAGTWVGVTGAGSEVKASNQISIFTGATGSAEGQYMVMNGGQLIVRGVYHEQSSPSLAELKLTGNGYLAIDATRFSAKTSEEVPMFSTDSFAGQLTLATCTFVPVGTEAPAKFELRGNGKNTTALVIADQFFVAHACDVASVWQNVAEPKAEAALIGCNINTSDRMEVPLGFAFLDEVSAASKSSEGSAGGGSNQQVNIDEQSLVPCIERLTSAHVWRPSSQHLRAMDLCIHRVFVVGGWAPVVAFTASASQQTGTSQK